MQNYLKSAKLDNVCYEIRGVVLREARRLEEEGHRFSSSISATQRLSNWTFPRKSSRTLFTTCPWPRGMWNQRGCSLRVRR